MNKKIYYIGVVISLLFFIGYFICRFACNSNFLGMHPNEFIAVGLILNLILMMFVNLKDKKIK